MVRRFVLSACLGSIGLGMAGVGCTERGRALRTDPAELRPGSPNLAPVMINDALPFRYPVELYVKRVQGNVLLRLHVDSSGRVIPDSTRLAQSSGFPSLDSAALAGAGRLRFRAARRSGVPIAVSLLFPVHFRHPDGPRPAGDSTSAADR